MLVIKIHGLFCCRPGGIYLYIGGKEKEKMGKNDLEMVRAPTAGVVGNKNTTE